MESMTWAGATPVPPLLQLEFNRGFAHISWYWCSTLVDWIKRIDCILNFVRRSEAGESS